MEILFYVLLGLLGVVQALDVWCSYDILTKHGREKNLLVRFLIKHLGVIKGLLFAKFGIVAPAMGVLFYFRHEKYALPTLAALTIYYLILLLSYVKRSK